MVTTKLYLGDCLNILPALDLKNVSLIIADPPYNILNKKAKWDKIIPIERMWSCLLPKINITTPIILFSQEPYTSKLILSKPDLYKYKWYYAKTSVTGFLNAKKQPMRCIEEILVFYKKQCFYNPQKTQGHNLSNFAVKNPKIANKTQVYGNTSKIIVSSRTSERYPRQLLTFKSDKQKCCIHPTQKPLALIEYLIKTYTIENDIVLDFCMGSGTTGAACINLKRNFIGIEADKDYFIKAKERLHNIEAKNG